MINEKAPIPENAPELPMDEKIFDRLEKTAEKLPEGGKRLLNSLIESTRRESVRYASDMLNEMLAPSEIKTKDLPGHAEKIIIDFFSIGSALSLFGIHPDWFDSKSGKVKHPALIKGEVAKYVIQSALRFQELDSKEKMTPGEAAETGRLLVNLGSGNLKEILEKYNSLPAELRQNLLKEK